LTPLTKENGVRIGTDIRGFTKVAPEQDEIAASFAVEVRES
jgi:hypothetical protein